MPLRARRRVPDRAACASVPPERAALAAQPPLRSRCGPVRRAAPVSYGHLPRARRVARPAFAGRRAGAGRSPRPDSGRPYAGGHARRGPGRNAASAGGRPRRQPASSRGAGPRASRRGGRRLRPVFAGRRGLCPPVRLLSGRARAQPRRSGRAGAPETGAFAAGALRRGLAQARFDHVAGAGGSLAGPPRPVAAPARPAQRLGGRVGPPARRCGLHP